MPTEKDKTEDTVTEADMESFPASDAPSYATPHPEYQEAGQNKLWTRRRWISAMAFLAVIIIGAAILSEIF